MKKFTEQIVIALQQVHLELLDAEELMHPDSTEQVNINQLIRPSYSKRVIIPNLLKTLVRSLHEFDFIGGIIISGKNHHVIDGWHRVEIWKEMGKATIPCLKLNVNQEQERKLHLSLNRHVVQFQASDFGFTTEFAGLDLVGDYGFCKTDFLQNDPYTDEKEARLEDRTMSISKLITSLPESYHLKMESLKRQMPAPNKSEVLIKLIDFYENYSGEVQ